jgi:hypothetical protein
MPLKVAELLNGVHIEHADKERRPFHNVRAAFTSERLHRQAKRSWYAALFFLQYRSGRRPPREQGSGHTLFHDWFTFCFPSAGLGIEPIQMNPLSDAPFLCPMEVFCLPIHQCQRA